MRAWENRADTLVMDEPFYACYLNATGIDHPMRAEIIAAQSCDWGEVAGECAHAAGARIVYQKHMAQHMLASGCLDWTDGVLNAFLIRPPEEVLASYHLERENPTAADVGFALQGEIFDRVAQRLGTAPPVLESHDVLTDPEGALRRLCAALGVGFDPAMLVWPAGKRPSDGVWRAHWYGGVEKSTGFAAPRPPNPLPDSLRPVADLCRPHYEALRRRRLA